MNCVAQRFFLLVFGVFMCIPLSSHAALLYVENSEGVYGPGDTFITTIRVDNENDCINAGRIILDYPESTIKAVDFSRGDSLFTLWIDDPLIDNERGLVIFEAGIPGGYCGRIQGDPALSNVLGRVIFTVLEGDTSVTIAPSSSSEIYISDGAGTRAEVRVAGASLQLASESIGTTNPWLAEIGNDAIPPEPFIVRVESTDDVFSGNYYAVFSTVDKQSGLSHFEIFERGAWKRVESPYQLRDQRLEGGVSIKAIDKAGNERVGEFDPESVPERKAKDRNLLFFSIMVLLVLVGIGILLIEWKRRQTKPVL